MGRQLPPLNALRAFEAGARHLSFTKAAEELHVTQTAISHQVRVLENYFDMRLFKRMTRQLKLTQQGKRLLPVIEKALDSISEVSAQVRDPNNARILTATLTPAFAATWLVRRLGRFWDQYPAAELCLHHSAELIDFRTTDMDLGVRSGGGSWPGLKAELLMRTDLIPVCSPELIAAGPKRLRHPADLRHYTLLHEDDYSYWRLWLRQAGAEGVVDARRGQVIDDTTALMLAAAAGHGVALGRYPLIEAELASGRLVAPFDIAQQIDSYYVVYPAGSRPSPQTCAFRDFLLSEARA